MSDAPKSADDPPEISSETRQHIKTLLDAVADEAVQSGKELLPTVYDQLKCLAAHRMGQLGAGQTLQATALVHEAYVRIVGAGGSSWNGKGHFFGAAAQAMREIVVEHYRARGTAKRGGRWRRESESFVARLAADGPDEDVVSLNESLQQLEVMDPRSGRLVTLRYFGGLSMSEAADVLGVSITTAERDWRFARTWLWSQLREGDGGEPGAT